jgi:hypothetical protein
MTSPSAADFDRLYQSHLKHLKLKGLQPKTIEAYARAVTPLDRGGVQVTMRKVAQQCGLKKRSVLTAFATAMPPI